MDVLYKAQTTPNHEPVAVRYAWADFPIANLYNSVDLPACPFRAELAPVAEK